MPGTYAQPSLIQQPELLTVEHVPEQLVHRMDQLQAVAGAIEPVLYGRTPQTTVMHGPSGAGKTSLAKHFLQKVTREGPQAKTAYVNCWEAYSEFDVLQALVQELGKPILRGKVSSKELAYRLEQACHKLPCVIVLDEVDQLQGKKVLYTLGQTHVGLILVTNDDRLLFSLDERIASRLGPVERVHFPPYSQPELQDIVESRARHALAPSAINSGQLRRIAAASGGNAHLAIESLRLAAERAEAANAEQIGDAHVAQAVATARTSVRTKSYRRLNPEQQLLHQIIKEYGEIQAGLLHREYQDRASDPVSERAVRKYLHKLEQYGFIRMHGTGRWRVYATNGV